MKSFDFIAYSRIANDRGSANTQEHLEYCATLPFTTLKADVRPTKDDRVILCHDKGFTLNEEGRIVKFDKDNYRPILEMTEAECLSLEHDEPVNGHRCKVTDVETFIRICKESGKRAFITVRDQAIDRVIAFVMPLLAKYDMIDQSIINSFTISTLKAFREADASIRLSYVLPRWKAIEKEDVDVAKSLGNCLVTSFHFSRSDVDGGWEPMNASQGALEYAAAQGVLVYQAQVSEAISLEDLVKRGYSGAQILYSPWN